MNIFVLDRTPHLAARAHCDKHVGKMLLESVQILSTVTRGAGFGAPYRATHCNHPCTLWAAESAVNYAWLVRLALALDKEFTQRYGKRHKSGLALREVLPIPDLPERRLTPFAQAMPEEYRNPGDPVGAYRAYYRGDKAGFARWEKGREAPVWWMA